MASSPSRELTAAELATVLDLPEAARADPRYVADHAVRVYQVRGLAALVRDLGWSCDAATELTIRAGIGTLVLRPGGTQFTPASTGPLPSPAQPLPAPEDLAAHRRGICGSCTRSMNDRCGVAGCACTGLGQPDRLLSRCPEGQW
jgi:hypothetical protein